MVRSLTLIVIVTLLGGCDRDRATEVIQLAPLATASMRPAQRQAPQPVEVPDDPRWSASPPYPGSVQLRLDRDGKRLRFSEDQLEISLTIGAASDCTPDVTQVVQPETMPAAQIDDKPVWVSLQGDDEAASLRLSTRGALLVYDDGCQRTVNVTQAILGKYGRASDPIFASAQVAPKGAYDAEDIEMRRRGMTGATVLLNQKPLIDVKFFSGDSTFAARALEDRRWVRLLMAREWEYDSHDGAIGREHTLVWTLHDRETPLLVFDNDYRYGLDGANREQTHVRSTRTHLHGDGLLEAAGVRKAEQVMSAPGTCRSADPLSFLHVNESVRWTFTDGDEEKLKLGTAKLRATFATDCIDIAVAQATRRRAQLIDRAPDAPVRWSHH